MKVPERVTTIVIGNPLIADASLQTGGLIVITGKGYGTTNLIALDRKGNALMEKIVQVLGPQRDVVVVYKGVNRETYSCAPDLQPDQHSWRFPAVLRNREIIRVQTRQSHRNSR